MIQPYSRGIVLFEKTRMRGVCPVETTGCHAVRRNWGVGCSARKSSSSSPNSALSLHRRPGTVTESDTCRSMQCLMLVAKRALYYRWLFSHNVGIGRESGRMSESINIDGFFSLEGKVVLITGGKARCTRRSGPYADDQ